MKIIAVSAFDNAVFGAGAGLLPRKLLPALYHRLRDGRAAG